MKELYDRIKAFLKDNEFEIKLNVPKAPNPKVRPVDIFFSTGTRDYSSNGFITIKRLKERKGNNDGNV